MLCISFIKFEKQKQKTPETCPRFQLNEYDLNGGNDWAVYFTPMQSMGICCKKGKEKKKEEKRSLLVSTSPL